MTSAYCLFIKNLRKNKMDTFTPKERSSNFSQLEKLRFQALIEKYKDVLFTKKTDHINNLKKNKTWAAIHAEFNAGGDQPRTLTQLKSKFDNMKKTARKDASQERQSRIKTGGGPPGPSVQKETEWFRTVMPISMDGLPSVVGDDFIDYEPVAENHSQEVIIINQPENIEASNPSENITYTVSETVVLEDNEFNSKSPASLLRIPVSKPLRIRKRTHNRYQDLKCETLEKVKENEENIYKLEIKHMEEKRKEEMEIYQLKKKKLLLEISLLENKS